MPSIGIDIGTQSLKAVVLDDGLRLLGAGGVPYQPSLPRPGWAEQDPQLWLDALQPAIASALKAAGLMPADIDSIAVAGQLDGCVPVDRTGTPLSPAIIWMDRRADDLMGAIDSRMIAARTGLVLDATHMGGKTAWLSRHLPSRSDVATWHQPVSYVVACLTGASVISPSLASTTMLYDLAEDDWADDLAALFGARHGQLPRIAPEASAAGTLTRAGAALTGLPAAMPVAVGTGDDFTNLIGSGISEPGIAAVSLGTAEALGAVAERPHLDPAMLVETRRFPGVAYHIGNPGWLSGGAVRWAAGLLGVDEEAFNTLAASAPPGSDGLVFIPALAGAMTPKWIAGARGSFVGLTPSHGRGHMARAVLEGVAFAMRDVIDRLDALGSTIARARLIGGGARSALWCQIRADLIGRPIEALTESDASAVGAAVLAHVLAGRDPDIGSATRALPLNLTTYEPNRAHRGPYDAAYARYREVFAALEPAWRSPMTTRRPVRALS